MADEDKKAAAMFREIENRLVWLTLFVTARATGTSLASFAAKAADDGLDEYQSRFAAIPPDGPPC